MKYVLAVLLFMKSTAMLAAGPSEFIRNFEKQIKKIEFENGLKLLLLRRDYAPTVAAYIKFKAGSVDESPVTSGIAHMLEHMLFKGTRQVGTLDYAKEEKYLFLINSWARKMDQARREADRLRAAGDPVGEKKALKDVERWQKRIQMIQQMAQAYRVPDEDSLIYSEHGQRGYNAYTSRDLTNYQIELPANRLEVWARLESDRIAHSVLREFYTERDVVAEERRMRTENIARNLLIEQYLARVYADHPYGRPVIGPMENIIYFDYDSAYDFYRKYYAPNNTTIALVGDLDFSSSEALVRRYFGSMESQYIDHARHPAPPRRFLEVDLKSPGSPFLLMGWFKPALPHPDNLRMELLSSILAGSSDSRLNRSLVMEQKIAASISAYASFPGDRHENLFVLMAVPAPGISYERLEAAIEKEMQLLTTQGVTADELQRARRSFESDIIYRMRSNAGMADLLSFYETVAGDYRILFREFENLETIDVEDVNEAARRHLVFKERMIGRIIGDGQ
ncbi:MAG: insulinase family protein [Spirochaetales bacterium]|nr:insulinase family protein [Spirochaetales bacterium]